jgi:2,4-dienoyl-CoA reductase-like NADH-dependent reductase (Old Yellow Enzyme family)
MRSDPLLQPFQLKQLTYRNRIVTTAGGAMPCGSRKDL